MIRAILVLSLIAAGLADTAVINDAVDLLIESAKDVLRSSGQNVIQIPDINKTFEKKVWTVVVHGEFHASQGSFKDVASMKRTGDVTMETQGNKVTLSASMGLEDLDVDFGQYSFKFLAVHSEGSIHASCKDNSISAIIDVIRDGSKCTVQIQKVQIDRIGNFDVTMSGPGDLNRLGTMLFTWILNHFNDTIKVEVNNHLLGAVQKALKKVDLCEKIPF